MNKPPRAKERLETLEKYSARATLIIAGGVIIEVFALDLFPHPVWEKVFGTLGNLAVALGLILEYVVIQRTIVATRLANAEAESEVAAANERAAAAEQKAAEANERAAEIERITAGRRLNQSQFENLVIAIRKLSVSLTVLIQNQRSDAEAFTFANDINRAFTAAGIQTRRGENEFLTLASPLFGVLISVDKRLDFGAFGEVFGKGGIQVVVSQNPPETHSTGFTPAPNLYVFVAPKPPPDMVI